MGLESSLHAYVINLERRPDRLAQVRNGLERTGLNWTRVVAVDGQTLNSRRETISALALTDDFTAACWMSHVLALKEFLNSSHTHALILEDDIDLSQPIALNEMGEWLEVMEEFRLDLLQVGYIDGRGILFRFKRWAALYRRKNLPMAKSGQRLKLNSCAVGAHGYLINRRAARAMAMINQPVWLPTDAVMMYLADSQQTYGRVRTARLVPSRLHQIATSTINPSDIQGRSALR